MASSFFPKVLATALGIGVYEMALRPLVVNRGRRDEPSDDDQDDEFLSEDWDNDGPHEG